MTSLSAQQKVFGVYELAEHIIASAAPRTILNLQRVNRSFRDITKKSRKVQRALWLLPDPRLQLSEEGKIMVNPLLLEHVEKFDWQKMRYAPRADHPSEFLVSLVRFPDAPRDYRDKRAMVKMHPTPDWSIDTPDSRMFKLNERRLRQLSLVKTVYPAERVRQLPSEINVNDIEIVTNRVRFLRDFLEDPGSWKDMLLFQPNPFVDRDATFGYWVYQKGKVDELRCNGGKWAVDLTVGDVLKTVLRLNRDLETSEESWICRLSDCIQRCGSC